VIGGIGQEFNKIIRFDDRDAVANTNEFEYSIVNRFFTRELTSDLTGRRSKRRPGPADMKPVHPSDKIRRREPASDEATAKSEPPAKSEAPATEQKEQKRPEPAQTTETKSHPAKSEAPGAEQKEQKRPEPAQTTETKSQLETGEKQELSPNSRASQKQETTKRNAKEQGSETETAASNENATPQAYEMLTIKVAQKYFFDRTFGGALIPGSRNQFYPINTLSGFTSGGRARNLSPVNVAVRYRPLSTVYADLRMDVGNDDGVVRNITVGGGLRKDKLSVSASYYLSRKIKLEPNAFEPGTFPGDQVSTIVQLGDEVRGLYGGARISYDFTNRFISDTQISRGRLMNSRSYIGYAWDCCGVQFNYNTFKAGLRNENAWSFTFTLAGLGSYGTDQFSQLGGGRGARKRGKRMRGDDDFLP
jgi:hypothetical protein